MMVSLRETGLPCETLNEKKQFFRVKVTNEVEFGISTMRIFLAFLL
jgi:hypothetical protein